MAPKSVAESPRSYGAARLKRSNTGGDFGATYSMRSVTSTTLVGLEERNGDFFHLRWPQSCRCCQQCARALKYICRKVASSPLFSGLTTMLTIYALFGDDMRLLFTDKPSDWIFDCITITGMVVFALEIFVCCLGKPGYVFGFFFWLDTMATITLVLDVTTVAEALFGDSISNMNEQKSNNGGGNAGGDSAEAARAARMSRAGTKAGRVVRLIRLVKLIRFVRFYKKGAYQEQQGTPGPGLDWDDDEDHNVSESAVSKKLSEMTTRRVIMLVLWIMLSLPFFQPSMYTSEMPTSAQYGINHLYRIWREGLSRYLPLANATQRQTYLHSRERAAYVDDFFMYVYYHNPFCDSDLVPSGALASPLDSFGRLFWIGVGPAVADDGEFFFPRLPGGHHSVDLNRRWNGADWLYYQCNLTSDPALLLDVPWNQAQRCLGGTVRGVSLIKRRESRADCPEKLRFNERSVTYPTMATTPEWKAAYFMFVFDRRSGSKMEALLNTAQTLFICFLLGFGAMTFSNDANRFVLTPIERMIAKIDKIRNDPLAALTIGDEERHREQVAASRKPQPTQEVSVSPPQARAGRLGRWASAVRACCSRAAPKQAPEPMETVVLEKTIVKIGSLLALGFGEAGAEIIGQNMKGENSSTLNAMIPGRRVDAIFGFCDIRNFTDATEVLEDQVMVFVNRIAGVVHSCINEFFGSPNKNIGNAFLLAWRLSEHPPKKQQRLADMALIALVKIIAQINQSPTLAEYRTHPRLVKRLPNYRVRMGFGLHSGWSIEGAIGSEFKIDASYLSPNVNMAVRLEAVTKLYGCQILMSDSLMKLMSEPVKEECRLIDYVKMDGTKKPFQLYTIDLDDLALEVEQAGPSRVSMLVSSKSMRFKQRHDHQRKKQERWSDDFVMHDLFESEDDIATMRSKFTDEFFCRFKMAYLNYEAGEWSVAKDMLEVTRFLLATEDGPSAALLKYMRQYDFVTPKAWPGFRLLTEQCAAQT